MTTLVRKNLIVDDAKLKKLAAQRGKSESATVRELVDFALAAEEIGDVFRRLQKRGGVDDVFERLPEEERSALARRQSQARPSGSAGPGSRGHAKRPTRSEAARRR